VKDFAPIGQIAEAQGVLVVYPGLPVNTVKELIAYAKGKPQGINYASAGSGTAPHISAEEFKLRTGVEMTHIPYKGSAPGVTDTLAGQTQLMFPSLVAAMQHIKTGKLRALAVTGKNRSPLFPSLPTIAESGVPGFDVTQWYGFFAPARTSREVVQRLHGEILAVMKDGDTVKKFAEQGADIVTTTPEEFGKFVQSEIQKWTKVVKAANITAD
jgi:tripartite-type tricarboxylate transporter receptor subunit TctC